MKLKIWFLETRPSFLLLSVVLIFLGTTMAWYDGSFNLWHSLLAFVGLLLLHISVNVLNDYFDYRSGIDLSTRRTPFSGGSGILPAALLEPASVFRFGMICFLLAVPIGIYFVLATGWLLLPLLVVGAVLILLYTTHITRLGWPELAPGLGMGMLPVLGAYFVQSESYPLAAILACIPSGILVHNLLLLNEFPDIEADKKGGRKTMPIALGEATASKVYSGMTVAVYLWIIGLVAAGLLPVPTLLGLLTIPWAVKAIRGALSYHDQAKLLPALGANVLVILLTQLLLGAGFIMARLLQVY
jgi:1,4-dihydroxy-2-naphthoate octaprenyltransferase